MKPSLFLKRSSEYHSFLKWHRLPNRIAKDQRHTHYGAMNLDPLQYMQHRSKCQSRLGWWTAVSDGRDLPLG